MASAADIRSWSATGLAARTVAQLQALATTTGVDLLDVKGDAAPPRRPRYDAASLGALSRGKMVEGPASQDAEPTRSQQAL